MKPAITVSRKTILQGLLLAGLLALAFYMRYTVVTQSWVFGAYRADAAQYYNYAYNLKHYGVYSRDSDSVFHPGSNPPQPDAMRTPGYPLFLVPLVGNSPDNAVIRRIQFWQVAIGTLTVLLVFVLFSQLLSFWQAFTVALLTAISPHLINTTNYMLSENLFTPLLILVGLLFCLHVKRKTWFVPALIATGVLIGLSALTRPVLEYYLPLMIILMVFKYPRTKGWMAAGCLVLGFALAWGPWVARNYVTLGKAGDNHLMLATLHQGIYPGMMYNGKPESLGYPYRFDPNYARDNKNLSDVLGTIYRHFRENPASELGWYLFGKPVMLWSWSMVAGAGDVFIYPTLVSPYKSGSFPLFLLTHSLMRGLHWILIITAFLGCVLAWLPFSKKYYSDNQLLVLRAISLLLLYNTAVLMVGAPFTRYSIPFLPLAYGMAIATVWPIAGYVNEIRLRSRANSRAGSQLEDRS